MEKINKRSWQQAGMLLVIVLVTAAMTAGAVFIKNNKTMYLPLFLLCGVLFSILLILYMEWNRIEKGILDEKANNFIRIGGVYALCCGIMILGAILPDYTGPILAIAFLMTMAGTTIMGITTAIYCSILLCAAGRESMWMLSCYLLLDICGAIVAFHNKNREKPVYNAIIVSTFSFCCVLLFHCLEYGFAAAETYINAIINAAISSLIVVFFYHFCYDKIAGKRESELGLIVEERYSLVDTMKAYSQADYSHARKVSNIAGRCAAIVGADESIAKAGGLYYRIGRLEGEPYLENGISVALSHRFPPEITKILCEYNGEKELPSTLESAIIHIVDTVVAKFEVLDKATLTSSWNQDIVIYQTLNDNSAQGLYDKAGLSMNMFLKIRDYLIKEAELF